jgi:hypothetical protein
VNQHVAPSLRLTTYFGDGVNREFAVPFPVWDVEGLYVAVSSHLVPSDAYVLTGLGDIAGATLTFNVAPEDGARVVFAGSTPRERKTDYNEYATLRAEAMNLDENYQEVQIQELSRDMARTLKAPLDDGILTGSMDLPPLEERKDSFLGFDEEGRPVAYGTSGGFVKGIPETGSTPEAIMVWADASGLQAEDSHRLFGAPNGAATLDSSGKIDPQQLPDFSVSPSGSGVDLVDDFVAGTILPVHRLSAGPGATVTDAVDGSVRVALDTSYRMYYAPFTLDGWDDGSLVYEPSVHQVGDDGRLLVTVRDSAGYDTEVNVNVSETGVVTLTTDSPFAGSVRIYGGFSTADSGMANPMAAAGDIIYSSDNSGSPNRLAIGMPNSVLAVSGSSVPSWTPLGDAAWKGVDVPGGLVSLNNAGTVPDERLPFSTMTYKGNFGVNNDLPATGALDGDVWVCNAATPYYSSVAGITFQPGAWAIFNGTTWSVLPANVDPTKAARDASNLTDADVAAWHARLFGGSLTDPGYWRLGALILQWGKGTGGIVTFPIPFPNAYLKVQVTKTESSNSSVRVISTSRTAFSYEFNGSGPSTGGIIWMAIGY